MIIHSDWADMQPFSLKMEPNFFEIILGNYSYTLTSATSPEPSIYSDKICL